MPTFFPTHRLRTATGPTSTAGQPLSSLTPHSAPSFPPCKPRPAAEPNLRQHNLHCTPHQRRGAGSAAHRHSWRPRWHKRRSTTRRPVLGGGLRTGRRVRAGEEGRPGMGQEMSVGRPVGLAEGGGGVAIHESG
jgi:hypothetical protein